MPRPDMPSVSWTFLRFLGNGVIATLVHFTALRFLLEQHLTRSAAIATGIASVLGILTSYLGNRWFVFRSGQRISQTLPAFLFIYGAVAAAHMGVLAVWTDRMGLPYAQGFVIATALSLVVTFLGNKLLVFRPGLRV